MCKSNDERPAKIDLEKFDEIQININKEESLKLIGDEWIPKRAVLYNEDDNEGQEEEEDEEEENKNDEEKEKIETLKKEIEEKERRKNELEKKTEEIEIKIKLLKKILTVDISEKEYVEGLAKEIDK